MKLDPSAFDGLHVLADDDPRWPIGPLEQARAACDGGARVVQLRAKHASDTQTLEWARAVRELTRAHDVRFVLNDRFDLALAAGADGVHLGQNDLPPRALPRDARERLAVGRSTHDASQARTATREDVDYVAYGPVFGTTSKTSEYAARGLESLAEIVALVAPLPVVAIGGIDVSNVDEVAAVGARGVAVISAVAAASDPKAATHELALRIDG